MNIFRLKFIAFITIGLQEAIVYEGETHDNNLIKAVESQNIDAAKKAISEGANIDARRTGDRRTPLMIAASTGNKKMVELILANNAFLDFIDTSNNTAASIAKSHGKWEIAKIIEGEKQNRKSSKITKYGLGAAALIAATYYYLNRAQ